MITLREYASNGAWQGAPTDDSKDKDGAPAEGRGEGGPHVAP